MNYHTYTAEDFVLDKKFRRWVLASDSETNLFWDAWIAQHPEKVLILKEARALLLKLPDVRHMLDEDEENQLWDAINEQIMKDEHSHKPTLKVIPLNAASVLHQNKVEKKSFWNHSRLGKLAASILIVLSLGIAYHFSSTDKSVQHTEVVSKENSWGQRSIIYLSDGTEVTLNAGSKIQYHKEFTQQERVVCLQGEAFFKVAKDPGRPFKVKTGDVVTQALGTSFNVQAYAQNSVEIALVSGKVSVQHQSLQTKTDNILLEPGESAIYHESYFIKSHFDARKVLSWKEGIIYFENAGEETVFDTLERWYGVKINRVNTTVKEWNYTASFNNRSLEHVLMSIGFAMDFHYDIDQKNVIIKYN